MSNPEYNGRKGNGYQPFPVAGEDKAKPPVSRIGRDDYEGF